MMSTAMSTAGGQSAADGRGGGAVAESNARAVGAERRGQRRLGGARVAHGMARAVA